jgi:DNA (cytosine-5)-methyltransferase 1
VQTVFTAACGVDMGLIVDSFAGGGGVSVGLTKAFGRAPDIAINHDPISIAMHEANHPETLHLTENIWKVNPLDYVRGKIVDLAWFSPDCKHFSKAKGSKPLLRNIRDLAWVVVRWAREVNPRVIILENVEEFRTWGPLTADQKPCPDRKGETFDKWVGELRRLGYKVEWRELRACDYGAPTIRKRLFLIARRDGEPIVWPEPTHGHPDSPLVKAKVQKPYLTTADEVIDWSLPCHSIFLSKEEGRKIGVKRPLAPNTMARIAKGVVRYVLEASEPFVVTLNHGGAWQRGWSIDEPMKTVTAARDAHALVTPYLSYAQHGGANRSVEDPMHTVTASRKDQNVLITSKIVPEAHVAAYMAQHNTGLIGRDIKEPLATVTATGSQTQVVTANLSHFYSSDKNGSAGDPDAPLKTVTAGGMKHALVATHISRQFGQGVGHGTDEPLATTTAGGGGKSAIVAAFLNKYYGTDGNPFLREPIHTVTTKHRFSLVTVNLNGETYVVEDICMRMLQPRELFNAQGFPKDYKIDITHNGRKISKADQIRNCGNSVPPAMAEALAKANCQFINKTAPQPDLEPLPLEQAGGW